MVTAIHLEQSTLDALDTFVASGGFASHDEAIRSALAFVDETNAADNSPLTANEIAGIERGLADMRAGRVHDLDEVFDELEQRCRADH